MLAYLLHAAAAASFWGGAQPALAPNGARLRQPVATAEKPMRQARRAPAPLLEPLQQPWQLNDEVLTGDDVSEDGFVFGRASIEAAISALRNGSLVVPATHAVRATNEDHSMLLSSHDGGESWQVGADAVRARAARHRRLAAPP